MQSLAARFWSKVDKREADECWPWLAGKKAGYGRIKIGDTPVQATHVSLHLAGKPRPSGLAIMYLG